MPAWIAKLRNEGWEVDDVLDRRADQRHPGSGARCASLAGRRSKGPARLGQDQQGAGQRADQTRGSFRPRLEAVLAGLEGKPNAIVLVTDLEALHPYLRIGAIEAQLQGKFHVPTVFLYPGVRTGKTRLKFLGFYPEDGNYRSVHVGG